MSVLFSLCARFCHLPSCSCFTERIFLIPFRIRKIHEIGITYNRIVENTCLAFCSKCWMHAQPHREQLWSNAQLQREEKTAKWMRRWQNRESATIKMNTEKKRKENIFFLPLPLRIYPVQWNISFHHKYLFNIFHWSGFHFYDISFLRLVFRFFFGRVLSMYIIHTRELKDIFVF